LNNNIIHDRRELRAVALKIQVFPDEFELGKVSLLEYQVPADAKQKRSSGIR
jgi:hypothetical protein